MEKLLKQRRLSTIVSNLMFAISKISDAEEEFGLLHTATPSGIQQAKALLVEEEKKLLAETYLYGR